MSATITQGRRVDFRAGFPGSDSLPGDYAKVPAGVKVIEGLWVAVDPTGHALTIGRKHHRVTEHEDGTITVKPSIVAPGGWHGFLQRGVWKEV